MKRLSTRLGGCLLAAALLAAPIAATTLVEMSPRDLAKSAELVVTGRCSGLETQWLGKSLVTLATVEVTDTLKGAPGATVTVVLPGGIDSKRPVPVAQIWPDAPSLSVGQEAFLFLSRRADVPGGYAVTGYSQGLFPIVASPTGEKMVQRGLRSADEKKVQGGATATSLSVFKSQIQSLLQRSERDESQR